MTSCYNFVQLSFTGHLSQERISFHNQALFSWFDPALDVRLNPSNSHLTYVLYDSQALEEQEIGPVQNLLLHSGYWAMLEVAVPARCVPKKDVAGKSYWTRNPALALDKAAWIVWYYSGSNRNSPCGEEDCRCIYLGWACYTVCRRPSWLLENWVGCGSRLESLGPYLQNYDHCRDRLELGRCGMMFRPKW